MEVHPTLLFPSIIANSKMLPFLRYAVGVLKRRVRTLHSEHAVGPLKFLRTELQGRVVVENGTLL